MIRWLKPRPPVFQVARLVDGAYLLTEANLSQRHLGAIKRAWPLYQVEHGLPLDGSRLVLDGDELRPA
jgi:hypothetical protein